ncbi:MAG: acetyl-CoA C-acyltransferase, partial [Actinobacteria bacterium]|nr:acetyl-CoA C-acyltransferase [Actinomycetota bacterium]
MADDIVLAGAVRTAVGTLGGVFAGVHPARLGAIAAAEALKRAGIEPAQVDEL